MPRDTRMSRMLHVLIHMDRHVERATSEDIAKMLSTNPAVVRRMMAGLRAKGFVKSEAGHGGGWQLSSGLDAITLLDVYSAIGKPPLFNIGPNAEHAECGVEQAVDARMEKTLGEAEALLMQRFATITVEDLAEDFDNAVAARKSTAQQNCAGSEQTLRPGSRK
ncbi:Rrf2 family transcriptional regulator [Pseudochelatococcus lubricantis]|nr:Rrf2 family transcriptional regulator [Pseudochelatococcus lubricantis]